MLAQSVEPAEEESILETLQDFLREGVVLVIGSGYSAGHGLPGMPALAAHLQSCVPARLEGASDQSTWKAVDDRLRTGEGLEASLQFTAGSPGLLTAITQETACFIDGPEITALAALSSGLDLAPLGRLAAHILKATRQLNVVTPNYDRLIEFQLEHSLIHVDTGYVGAYVGRYEPDRSALSNKEYVNDGRRGVRTIQHGHARIHKPHGSLDWYVRGSHVVRSTQRLDLPRAIITPGLSKYRLGYSTHFDQQRVTASKALERAQRILAIGYGFNDDQLEHSWCADLASPKQIVILTKTLSPNATKLLAQCKTAIALSEHPTNSNASLLHMAGGGPRTFPRPIWTIAKFVEEVIR